jgi:hypothetical protein
MERSASNGTLVHFRCTKPAHARIAPQRSDTLTLVEGLWAYCPFDVRVGDHEWEPTGGVTMESLRSDAGRVLFRQPPEYDARRGQESDAERR